MPRNGEKPPWTIMPTHTLHEYELDALSMVENLGNFITRS